MSGVSVLPRERQVLLGGVTTRGSSLLDFTELTDDLPSSGSSSLPSTISLPQAA